MDYYSEIKEILVKNEIYKRVKDYSKNKSDINSYYKVGELLVEAQGGEVRAKYGNKLIKEYSEKLTKELGKGYTYTNLSRMRQFYLLLKKIATVWQQFNNISWSHYKLLLSFEDINKVKYYVYLTDKLNLSVRELRERIKLNEYERIGYKEELKHPKVNTLIKNPIIIKTKKSVEKLNEYMLHQLILEDVDNFLNELGIGFTYVGSEFKIKIGDRYNYLDFLLFNYKYNCFVVIELKVTEMKAEYIGQITKYINYIDKHIKESFNNKTVGVIICKKENKFVMEYCTDNRIFSVRYEIEKSDIY